MSVNNNQNPATSSAGKEHRFKVGVTRKGVDGLSYQGMLCHQAVCELCDDSLAAALPDKKSEICVAMAQGDDDSYIHLAIADRSSGMDLNGLINAMQIGSAAVGDDRMNEHGYGLKNALMCLSGGNQNWCIYTRNHPGDYLYVEAPLTTDMVAKEVSEVTLPDGLNLYWDDPSTVVYMRVPMNIARTVQFATNSNTKLVTTLRRWLVEHLGVIYRGYLELDEDTQETSAHIVCTIGEDVVHVSAIPVPMMLAKTEELEVDIGNQRVKMKYIHGVLDETQRDKAVRISKKDREKCQYYYQGNQNTQGIDIRIGRRVIATAQMKSIWFKKDGSSRAEHNSYNHFVGELQIPDLPRSVLTTLTNKTGINPLDPDWDLVFSQLAKFPPTKTARSLTEKELRKKWMERIKSVNREDVVSDEVAVWPTATRIDVVDRNDNTGKYDLYELKANKADGQDLMQLRMYWDGLVVQGIQPTMGMLMASTFGDNLLDMLAQFNKLPTPCFPDGTPSAPYNLTIATFAELKFSTRTK